MEQKCTWNTYDMRNYCVDRNLYTCGDNEQYSKMLDFVSNHEPTEETVKLVAIDIISHSDRYSIFADGDIDYIACEIWNNVVDVTFIME